MRVIVTTCRLGALGLTCAVCCGCGTPEADVKRPLIVVAGGDTQGWLVPCGCTSNQSGGLLRRGTYVEGIRANADVIVVDIGGAVKAASAYDRVKFEAILQGEVIMDVAAHNIGQAEATLGADYLRDVTTRLNVPFVSANVFDRDGRPLAEPLRIVEAGRRRIALLGVLDPQYATDRLQVTPPRQALLDALQDVAGRYDSVVVLAYLPEDRLRELADMLPEADVVVGGPTGQPIPPQRIGPTLLASATHEGKFLARFDAPPTDDGAKAAQSWTGQIVELDDTFSDAPRQATNLKQFYDELARRDFAPHETALADPLDAALPEAYRLAGSGPCRECHPDEWSAWNASKHTGAWRSLEAKGAHVDPECQRCHVTGYGLPGGFASVKRSPESIDIGCESCHGPSQAHVDDTKIRTPHFARAKDHCTGCHDRENSPKFDYQKYWAAVRHGAASEKTSEVP